MKMKLGYGVSFEKIFVKYHVHTDHLLNFAYGVIQSGEIHRSHFLLSK